jgi:hypothetical protein
LCGQINIAAAPLSTSPASLQAQVGVVTHELAHALAGCVAGAAGSGSQGCQSGAIGAVVGELAAQWYDPTGLKSKGDTLEFVRVLSAVAGAMTGDGSAQSVNTAVMTGVTAVMAKLACAIGVAQAGICAQFSAVSGIHVSAALRWRLVGASCCWAVGPRFWFVRWA